MCRYGILVPGGGVRCWPKTNDPMRQMPVGVCRWPALRLSPSTRPLAPKAAGTSMTLVQWPLVRL